MQSDRGCLVGMALSYAVPREFPDYDGGTLRSMTPPRLALVASSPHGRDRGMGRYERDLKTMVRSLEQEGVLRLVTARSQAGWCHAIDLDTASWRSRRRVTSILDVIPLDMPAAYTRHGIRTRLRFERALRSEAVITISNFSASRVLQRCPRLFGSVHVVPVPVPRSVEWIAHHQGFVLAMADYRTPDARKRLHWIAQLGEALRGTPVRLTVVVRGDPPPDLRETGATLLCDVTDDELHRLMTECCAFFYPSAYEGQGLPPLEAMAAGAPVVAFDNSALADFLPHQFLLVDPHPWTPETVEFAPMPQTTLDDVVDLVLEHARRDRSAWWPEMTASVGALSLEAVKRRLHVAYAAIGALD